MILSWLAMPLLLSTSRVVLILCVCGCVCGSRKSVWGQSVSHLCFHDQHGIFFLLVFLPHPALNSSLYNEE